MSLINDIDDNSEKPRYKQDRTHYLTVLIIVVAVLLAMIILNSLWYFDLYSTLELKIYNFMLNVFGPFAVIFFLIFLVLFEFNFGDNSWKESKLVTFFLFISLTCVMILSSILGNSSLYNDNALVLLALLLGVFIGGYRFGIMLLSEIPITIVLAYMFYDMQYNPIIIPTLTSQYIIGLFWCYYLKGGFEYRRAKWAVRCASVILLIHALIAFIISLNMNNEEWLMLSIIFITSIIVIYATLILFRFCTYVINKDRSESRYRHDMSIASEIQMSCVPDENIISDRIKISGTMRPALEVGGDYFDYRKIREGLYLVVIGDVSDKRLPAAIFMLKAKGIIDTAVRITYDPGELLTIVNKELCDKNTADLFMTCWLGIIDIDMGIIEYANAGHKTPYLTCKNGISRVDMDRQPALGIYDSVTYRTQTIELGDMGGLFEYTDGVTECLNNDAEMFGESNLEKCLNEVRCREPSEIIRHIKETVVSFSDGAGATDDIAMISLAFDRTGYSTFDTSPVTDNLEKIHEFINGLLHDLGVAEKVETVIDILAEELFLNICHYSQTDPDETVRVLCYYENRVFQLTFIDKGVPFDPTEAGVPSLNKNIVDRDIGGLGIHMIRKLSDEFHYRYCHGMNITTVLKRIYEEDQQ